jgi:thioesterase domain-containing protein
MPEPVASPAAKQRLLEQYLRGDAPRPSLPHAARHMQLPQTPEERTPMVALNPKGTRPPFFFLHGDWTGNSFYCFKLAQALGKNQPFYVCDPYRFDGLTVLPSLSEMAATHISAIRRVQPKGPYYLGGFCNGGLLCYEMARQLFEQGEQTAALILVDAIPPRYGAIRTAFNALGTLLRAGEAQRLRWFLRLQHIYRFFTEHNANEAEHLKRLDARSDRLLPPMQTLFLEYPALFIWATAHYDPPFYPGKVTLLHERSEPQRQQWWQTFAVGRDQAVNVRIITGTHETCKTDDIEDFAAQLGASLEEAFAAQVSGAKPQPTYMATKR